MLKKKLALFTLKFITISYMQSNKQAITNFCICMTLINFLIILIQFKISEK